jgi:hypothetical protein
MTVQEVCDLLRQLKEAQGNFSVTGTGFPQVAIPAEVLDNNFLSEITLKLNDILKNKGTGQQGNQRSNFSSEGEMVAIQQAISFLSAYQKGAFQVKRRRCSRLASKYTRTIVNGNAEFGPLSGQLRDIGVKVDPDFVSFIAPPEEEQA